MGITRFFEAFALTFERGRFPSLPCSVNSQPSSRWDSDWAAAVSTLAVPWHRLWHSVAPAFFVVDGAVALAEDFPYELAVHHQFQDPWVRDSSWLAIGRIARSRSSTQWKVPRRIIRSVISPKRHSTWFSQELVATKVRNGTTTHCSNAVAAFEAQANDFVPVAKSWREQGTAQGFRSSAALSCHPCRRARMYVRA
jgi:hypothetical protein